MNWCTAALRNFPSLKDDIVIHQSRMCTKRHERKLYFQKIFTPLPAAHISPWEIEFHDGFIFPQNLNYSKNYEHSHDV